MVKKPKSETFASMSIKKKVGDFSIIFTFSIKVIKMKAKYTFC